MYSSVWYIQKLQTKVADKSIIVYTVVYDTYKSYRQKYQTKVSSCVTYLSTGNKLVKNLGFQ